MIIQFLFDNFGYVFCSLVFAVCLGSIVGYAVDWADNNWQ